MGVPNGLSDYLLAYRWKNECSELKNLENNIELKYKRKQELKKWIKKK
jgi:hypothetical protein